MRQSLMHSFEQIYVIDLHGSIRREEHALDSMKNENVFDIEQGVAITIFVKNPELRRVVRHKDLWGTRLEKYVSLSEKCLREPGWTDLTPSSPHYLFCPVAAKDDGYSDFTSILSIFPVRSTGVQTSRDKLVIGFTKEELRDRLRYFVQPHTPDDAIRQKYFREHRTGRYPRGDSRGWKLAETRQWAQAHLEELQDSMRQIEYRPFDIRYMIDHPKMIDWPRHEVMKHFTIQNVALLAPRQLAAEGFRHSFCADLPSEMCVIATTTKEQNYVFPLWLYSKDQARAENLSRDFRDFIDSRYRHHYTPEEIFGCIYAVLHAPAYRARYAEFLRRDFARVPFPGSADDFEVLSGLGWALIQAHLLRELPRRGLAEYHGRGDHRVEAVRYAPAEEAIAINQTQSFRPMPQAVWEFRIGGYQVLDKYLKSRKGRVLSLDEIEHVGTVADSLAFTIEQMARIDDAYRAAFPEQR
jgi:predicted helicase